MKAGAAMNAIEKQREVWLSYEDERQSEADRVRALTVWV
jgi:hypothetical protein